MLKTFVFCFYCKKDRKDQYTGLSWGHLAQLVLGIISPIRTRCVVEPKGQNPQFCSHCSIGSMGILLRVHKYIQNKFLSSKG